MLSKDILEKIELKTNLASLALMMPFEQFGKELFGSSYRRIESVVARYSSIETSMILEWIALHDYFGGHYAILFITKNAHDQEIIFKIDEYCRTNSNFDIMSILVNPNSIAYQSKVSRTPLNGESVIDNKTYFCFSFYERDIQQPMPSYTSPIEQMIIVDKLMIMGWPKDTYEFIQKLEYR
jgi:hypothetical protein